MKFSSIVVAVLAISMYACAQTPPESVSDNFNSKFQEASKAKWDQEEANEWEAEFKMNGNEMSASFDNAGTWLETEKDIQQKELPAAVSVAINDNYSEYKVGEVAELQKPGFSGYEIGIEKGEETLEIQLTSAGSITNIEKIEEEKD